MEKCISSKTEWQDIQLVQYKFNVYPQQLLSYAQQISISNFDMNLKQRMNTHLTKTTGCSANSWFHFVILRITHFAMSFFQIGKSITSNVYYTYVIGSNFEAEHTAAAIEVRRR